MRTYNNERGIALVLALFLMTAMSVLGVSLMFLSQTETYASMNYRMMSQARYAGEAGVQKAANFLLDSMQYPPPSGSDPLLNVAVCNRQVSPVTCNGQPVILSASSAQASNYPVAAVQTAFNTAAQGALQAGNVSINYKSYATLMAMQVFDSYGGGQSVVQTWQITGVGSLAAGRNATVEVVALVETPKVPASSYGAFATDNTCAALTFSGNVTINSYDSTSLTGATAPTMSSSGGDVGTNGNLTIGGSVDVQGNLYTPRTGVGACTVGAVDALTETGHATVAGSIIQLPTAVSYPPPPVPSPSSLSAAALSTTTGACALLGLTGANCSVSGYDVIIDGHGTTLSLPSVSLTGQTNIVLVADNLPGAQYNFNSITIASQSQISVQAASPTQAVLVNVVGKDNTNTDIAMPIDFTGGSYGTITCATCSAFDASMLQFVYGGSGEIKMKGKSGAAATFYAPNASVTFGGTSDLYGSILAKRVNETGSGNIHYDKRLSHDFNVAGHPMIGSFTWKRY